MIIEINYYNYLIDDYDKLKIEYPEVTYEYWKRTKEYKNDYDLCKILDSILNDINTTRTLNGQYFCKTTYPVYKILLSNYYYYFIKIQNQFIYNIYFNKLISRHILNIYHEKNNNIKIEQTKTTKPKKISPPDKYIRYKTIDMFTNKEIYLYINPKTNHEIKSEDPNLLNELNNKKKVKQSKQNSIPLEAMTFSFKK